jgi:multiple sugar transport system ATP-binding protein
VARIRLEHLTKRFPSGPMALHDLNLTVSDGEFLVLVGPSGSGKSTALRLVAGLETPTAGRVLFDDQDVTAIPPQDRGVAMVFQSYALYPHMTVRRNLGFGLRVRGRAPAEIARRVDDVARLLDIVELLERRPAQLSGGQRQRVALGRAIVREPRAFLFDEPLSNLDAQLRAGTRAELARLHRRLGATMVYVTHDQVEAITLGDRVAVLRGGVLQQVDTPDALYRRPANAFVATFIGSPAMNLLRGTLRCEGDKCRFQGSGLSIPLAPGTSPRSNAGVLLGIRPHDLALSDQPEALRLPVTLVERLGNEQILHLALPQGGELLAAARADPPIQTGDVVPVGIPAGAVHLFDSETADRRA